MNRTLLAFVLAFQTACTSTKNTNLNNSIDSKGRISVFIFMSSKCPCADSQTEVLPELISKYKIAEFFFVYSNKYDSINSVEKFQQSRFPGKKVIFDSDQRLAKKLKATHTPQVFVFDRNSSLTYSGPIINSFFSEDATENYLDSILNLLSSSKNVSQKTVEPIGCLIQ